MQKTPDAPSETVGETDSPGVVALPPLVYIVCLGIGLGLEYLLPSSFLPQTVQYVVGGAVIVLSLAIMPFVLREFRRARTSFDVRKPAHALITEGPYRYSRNPSYLSLTLLYVGLAIVFDSLWTLGMLIPALLVMHHGVITREERYLERRFDDDYRRYRNSVRRWL